MAVLDGSMTVGEIVAALNDENGDHPFKDDSIRRALTRNPETFTKSGDKWRLLDGDET